MTLKKLVSEIEDKMFEAMKDAIYVYDNSAGCTVNTDDGYIDLFVAKNGDVEAMVCHDDDYKRTSPNINAFCEKVLKSLSWDEAVSVVDDESAPTFEEEYAIHGESLFPRELQWHRM